MKYLIKTRFPLARKMLPLLGTEKIEENWLTPDFSSCFLQQKKYIWIKAHGLKLTENLYTLVVMKDLMKILLPLLGTEKIEENWLTPNFNNAFQQQKRNIWIKTNGVNLTQHLYTLMVMKDLMKTAFLLARKNFSTFRNWKIEENWLTRNFSNAFQQQKNHLNKNKRCEINPKSVYTSCDEGFDENCVSTSQKNCFHF